MNTEITTNVQKGFTLIELLVVMGIAGTLIALTTTNLLGLQRSTHLRSSTSTLLADLSLQRFRAMSGDTQGRSSIDSYGIHFQTNSYVLFHGTTFSGGSSDNLTVPFESPIQLQSTTFPGGDVVFTKGSGEIANFNSSQNSITLINTSSNETFVITLNRYGTVTSNTP